VLARSSDKATPAAGMRVSAFGSLSSRLLATLVACEIIPLVIICAAGYGLARQALGSGEAAQTVAQRIFIVDVVALALSLLAIVAGGFIAGRRLVGPVLQTARLAQRLEHGDLTRPATTSTHSEVDALIRAMDHTLDYIREIAAAAERVADGDLSVEITRRSGDDALGAAFERLLATTRERARCLAADAGEAARGTAALDEASRRAFDAAESIASAMKAVADGTTESSERIARIAEGAEEQRRAVLATSDTISQMSLAIEQVAVNAQAVAATSDSAYQAASEGGKRVREAVESMNSIRDAVVQSAGQIRVLGVTSKQISAISEFIGDIAEQTNLLALNAAIEAARAGEHGRGFAVVADEVRKLAARSANATSQISELTGKISVDTHHAIEAMEMGVARAEDGSELANRAGQALQAILLAVQQTNDQIQNISAAAEEMTASSGEVVAAINHISQVVVENSEATEQMSEMSQSNSDVTESVAASAAQLFQQVTAICALAESLNAATGRLQQAAQGVQQPVGQAWART